jgi:hypothetical protein
MAEQLARGATMTKGFLYDEYILKKQISRFQNIFGFFYMLLF